MQDPYFAVKEEVESSVTVVVDLHQRWKELASRGKKGDEFEWTGSELLSGLRSIEWDLQDLEDTVSIVEGNRQKFQLEEEDVMERKRFIEATRAQIVVLRDEVQGHAMKVTPGFATTKSGGPKMPSIGKKPGYGKVGGEELELEPASDIIGAESPVAPSRPSAEAEGGDEILGGVAVYARDLEMGGSAASSQSHGRHFKKKLCILLTVLLLSRCATL